MATIDLTLDNLLVPAIDGYTPPFGHKITKTPINNGGLSTSEVNSNIMMPFANMRPKVITENSSTTEIEYDAKLCFSSSLLAGATLELDDGAYEGCRVQITNLSSYTCDVEYNSSILVSIPTGANVEVLWTGSSWMLSTTGTVATGNIMAPTSSAVQAAIENIKDYVDASNSYSTEETLTGGVYIDNKPIYKKTWSLSSFSSTEGIIDSSGTYDKIISQQGFMIISSQLIPISQNRSADGITLRIPNISQHNLAYIRTSGVTSADITIEYTKTTN